MQKQKKTLNAVPEMSDAMLAQLVLEGDQEAFELLVVRYNTSLFNFICRFLGDYDLSCDVLQQVFLRFYLSLPKLGTGEPFKSWLFQVARNCCVDELRRRHRYALHFSQLETENSEGELSGLCELPDPGPLPEELMERRDLQKLLHDAIQALPPKFRAVVILRYASQLSFSEIGKSLSMPEATAKTYFHRAKVLLRKNLGPLQTVFA
ncbi:RNA polymerase sigma factor [Tengunoibacter tsumagoiensis]|uniref:RNA polymerase sigma factor n=1 Tax=Tengunoibacter tsumagoiensis TaxID=2014871 RepID=A0A402A496_9CHLR|nr:sigma-70 family RNA polymerase sigma factor [Tengunoibacter tsumagoiensis]GCE13963.1 RNA polymerase sigma factor [Tengunoibacter tsumagoiensis]